MSSSTASERPSLAIVSHHVTPYRVHLHRRIAAEIPELTLHSVFVGVRDDLNWELELPPEIHAVYFTEEPDAPFSLNWRAGRRKAERILAHLRERRVRAIVVNGYTRPSQLALILAASRVGLPIFLRGDSNIEGERAKGGLKGLVKRLFLPSLLRRCTGLMPMGELGQAWFERYGADPARCFRVPYEPDLEAFARCEAKELEGFKQRNGLDAERKRLLYVGRFLPIKRVDLLIDAFANVAEDQSDWELLLAGSGPLEDELRARVPESLRARVRFLGFLEVDDVRRATHAADALVLPSDGEPWGVVVQEAVAAGRAVVASHVVGAARELVRDGSNGIIFRAGDAGDLATALRRLDEPGVLAALKGGAAEALSEWKQRDDPVAGLRAALAHAGVVDA